MTRVRQMKTDFYSAKQNKSVNIPYSIHSFNNFVLENKKSVKIRSICVIRVPVL